MFSVGSKIVHPMHGAGIIQKIEEKKILGEVKQYYILKLPCNDMNVMIPVDSEQSVGIREIVDESAVRSAIEILERTAPRWIATGTADTEKTCRNSRQEIYS